MTKGIKQKKTTKTATNPIGMVDERAVEAKVIFTHPSLTPLQVSVNPDEITWAYGLNTASFPTYGGEVVQILSMYFDDMTIKGTVGTYAEIEKIYGWFLLYIQTATQGQTGTGSYNTTPITFLYPARGWQFTIYPKSLPSFKYGTEVVAPSWTITAAVAEPEAELTELVMDEATLAAAASTGGFEPFGTTTAAIGYNDDNPFSDPAAAPPPTDAADSSAPTAPHPPPGVSGPHGTTAGARAGDKPGDKTSAESTAAYDFKAANKDLADFFNKLIPAYLQKDFHDLTVPDSASGPPNLTPGSTDGTQTKAAGSISDAEAEKEGRRLNAPVEPGPPFVAPGGPANAG